MFLEIKEIRDSNLPKRAFSTVSLDDNLIHKDRNYDKQTR